MKYLIGIVVAILIIIFVIIKLLSGGSDQPMTKAQPLLHYANTNTLVRYTIDNPVQSNETHNDIIITVGKDQATLTVTQGYQGTVVRTQSYDNNQNAYANFLAALERTGGYTLGDTNKDTQDERGYCATGNRYSYDIVDGSGNLTQHLWATSCKQKTFKGSIDLVDRLFRDQIPDFNSLTNDVNI